MPGYQLQNSLPAGSIVAYRFASIPDGWLEMDGLTVNVDDYPALGVLYGGSPGGTFDLEDWSDVPLFGVGTGMLGDTPGSDTVDLSHTHGSGTLANASDGAHDHGGVTGRPSSTSPTQLVLGSVADAVHTHPISSDGAHTHSLSGSTGSGLGSTDKRPRRGLVKWIIRAY